MSFIPDFNQLQTYHLEYIQYHKSEDFRKCPCSINPQFTCVRYITWLPDDMVVANKFFRKHTTFKLLLHRRNFGIYNGQQMLSQRSLGSLTNYSALSPFACSLSIPIWIFSARTRYCAWRHSSTVWYLVLVSRNRLYDLGWIDLLHVP